MDQSWLGALAVTSLITVWWLAVVPKPPDVPLPGNDTFRHALAFAMLTVLWLKWSVAARWGVGQVCLFLLVNGVAIEFAQEHSNRSFEWLDRLADALGIALGALVLRALSTIRVAGDWVFPPAAGRA